MRLGFSTGGGAVTFFAVADFARFVDEDFAGVAFFPVEERLGAAAFVFTVLATLVTFFLEAVFFGGFFLPPVDFLVVVFLPPAVFFLTALAEAAFFVAVFLADLVFFFVTFLADAGRFLAAVPVEVRFLDVGRFATRSILGVHRNGLRVNPCQIKRNEESDQSV